jgi:hypothetical protein
MYMRLTDISLSQDRQRVVAAHLHSALRCGGVQDGRAPAANRYLADVQPAAPLIFSSDTSTAKTFAEVG